MSYDREYFEIDVDRTAYDCVPHTIFIALNVILLVASLLNVIAMFTLGEKTSCMLKCNTNTKIQPKHKELEV